MIAGYEAKLESFRVALEAAIAEYFSKKFAGSVPPKVEIMRGRKFDKVIQVERGSRRSYCYVNKATGGLLKGNWKKVEDHRERGNIFNDNQLQGCNPWGMDYMNMANYSFEKA